jgi:hypothetical protein
MSATELQLRSRMDAVEEEALAALADHEAGRLSFAAAVEALQNVATVAREARESQ